RFVRFVSTPEVLERFVTIEKEIVQIEGSVQSSEAEGNVSYAEGRTKRSTISSNQDGTEENSRVRLQRVLDNRKAMLCKEQAMAYARALVAG
ncbi:cop1-interacting protein 7, partial [Trifolium pratense]